MRTPLEEQEHSFAPFYLLESIPGMETIEVLQMLPAGHLLTVGWPLGEPDPLPYWEISC